MNEQDDLRAAVEMLERKVELEKAHEAGFKDGWRAGEAAERQRQEAAIEKHVEKARIEIGRRVEAEAKVAESVTRAIDALERAEVAEIDLRRSEAARAGLHTTALELLGAYRTAAQQHIDQAMLLAGERNSQQQRLDYHVAVYRDRIGSAATAGTPSAPPGSPHNQPGVCSACFGKDPECLCCWGSGKGLAPASVAQDQEDQGGTNDG